MKFKVSIIAYYGLFLLHLLIFALWLALILICPIQNWEDFSTILAVFLILELLLFTCSPIAHRTVTIDDTFITEKWLCFTFNQMEISKISDIGVCSYLFGNQVRQFAFVSTEKLSDEEVIQSDKMGIFQIKRHNGRFITIEHPQKGLDDCMKEIAERNILNYRQISV
ncbi:MAG TPA: hypothetical protein DEO95_12840 [Ruminococcaceae bacterium]|nr:hypothetical protein [Oscillospiraceae bacterium]